MDTRRFAVRTLAAALFATLVAASTFAQPAAPNGTLYVAVDGNGAQGRASHLGRILRLRDTTGAGQATEVKAFVSDVDSPRGIIWDHDRLYSPHPPTKE